MLKIRTAFAKIFKILFKINFIKSKYFGLYKRVFKPFNLFKGVVIKVKFNNLILILNIDDWIQSWIYFLGEYEMAELKTLDSFLNNESVFVDLGANFGLFTLCASNLVGENGNVFSFEPFKKNYKSLIDNISINKILNVQPENLAVGDKEGLINLYYDKNEMNLGMVTTSYIENSYCEKVNVVSLDYYFDKRPIQRIDFIKIDIEGNEYRALLGMKNILLRFHPTILVEILNDSSLLKNEKNINNYLRSFGYKKYFITDRGILSKTQTNELRQNYIFTTKTNF